jgi:hypothetical protein
MDQLRGVRQMRAMEKIVENPFARTATGAHDNSGAADAACSP